jgi:hypothetical protein
MRNKIRNLFALAAAAVMVGSFTYNVVAQDDASRAERRQRQIEAYQGSLGVKSTEDWKKIEPLVAKVVDAQRDARMGMSFGFGGGRGGGRGGGNSDQAAGGGNRNRFGGQPAPELEALEKAIDDKAPADEVKEKLAKFREARKAKESALEKTQDELRKALSPRQEAGAVLAGLLK